MGQTELAGERRAHLKTITVRQSGHLRNIKNSALRPRPARQSPLLPSKILRDVAAFPAPIRSVHSFRLLTSFCIGVLASGLASFAYGLDSAAARQLAADRGCYNCHAQPSRPSIRSFVHIADAYAQLRGKPGAEQQARDRMHHGGLFSHVAAHERLTEEEATLLVHWLFEGGG